MSTLLSVRNISKTFGQVKALVDVTLDIDAGEVHCLLGENGAGKSTLCNLIFGLFKPDSGTLAISGENYLPATPADALTAGIGMVHQHYSLVPNMTVIENLMLGRGKLSLPRATVEKQVAELVDRYGLELDFRRIVEDLSVGERQRVEIVKCLLNDPRMLLLDEPTAVLPPREIDSLLQICREMATAGHGIVLVTHKLAEISKVADRTTVLRRGRVVETVPMSNADMQSLVNAMIGQGVETSGSTLAASTGADDVANSDITEEAQLLQTKDISEETDRSVLQVEGLSFNDETGVRRLDNINFTVNRGEIVGIAGVEGNGQTELGAILAGMASPTNGKVVINGRDVTGRSPKEVTAAGAGIVPEDRHVIGCIPQMTVTENLFLGSLNRFAYFGILKKNALRENASQLLRQFDIRGEAENRMADLSGGNQQKVVLARELSHSNLAFLLAALPTRGLDVGATNAVYSRIRKARQEGVGVLMISNELDELIAVADRILVFYRGAIVGELDAVPRNRTAIGTLMSGHIEQGYESGEN